MIREDGVALRLGGTLQGVPTGCLVDGTWRDGATGERFSVADPATGTRLAEVADASPADGLAALDAACRAQAAWAAVAPRERSELLRRAFDALVAHSEELAMLATLEMGRPLEESRGEVRYAAEFLRWFGEEAVRVSGEYRQAPEGGFRIVTTRRAVGPCLLVTPWNFPLAMVTRKVAPALAAGCTVVLKPAEETPLSSLALARILTEAGLPDGVLNVVPTSRPGPLVDALLADRRLRKLSFTGSTEVGRQLLRGAAANVVRTSMELGGNSPFLVFDDADLDAAVEGAVVAKLRNGGQSCVAANRFLVHERVAEEFGQRLAMRLREVRIGPGTEPGSELGPLISEAQRGRLRDLVDDALDGGASLLTSGGPTPDVGWFAAPMVLVDVPEQARIRVEEIFGPVAPIYTFRTDAEALHAANATDAGLVAYLYTRDVGRALRVGEGLEAGMVGVNRGLVSNAAAPFGGVKTSGLGREGGIEGIHEYLAVTYLAVDAT